MQGYVDLYMLSVPKENLDAYRGQASKFADIIIEYGALNYRECRGDDLFPADVLSFTKASPIDDSETLVIAMAEFSSREHRDEVMEKMLQDPRMKPMMDDPASDMSKMYYGGFQTFVQG
jgi:uncharacterized protein YbaA (DUF1428 family)